MSIKPVDFQVMLPKTSEISRVHNQEQQKSQIIQQQQSLLVQNKVETGIKQVLSREKPQETRIKDKEEKNRENRKQNKKGQGENQEKNNKKQNQSFRSSTIDIRL